MFARFIIPVEFKLPEPKVSFQKPDNFAGLFYDSLSLRTMQRTISLIFLAILSSCSQSSDHHTAVSFYFWKTSFHISDEEREALKKNSVTKLYVRYFDIALKNNTAVPVSTITVRDTLSGFEIIPVIFIKNEVMLQHDVDIEDLANKTTTLVGLINHRVKMKPSEIQLDCDWSVRSKSNYFRYIEAIKKRIAPAEVSVTIRLHQVKYAGKTGIPPVRKGVLMYYNMGRIAADSRSSIYDKETAEKYVTSLKTYPIRLNVALPVFTWGIQIRDGKVIALLNKTDEKTFLNDSHFEITTRPFIEVREDAIKSGYYFKKGDRIKIESVSPDQLEEIATELSEAIIQKPDEIIFYDLDNFNLKNYRHEKDFFSRIGRSF